MNGIPWPRIAAALLAAVAVPLALFVFWSVSDETRFGGREGHGSPAEDFYHSQNLLKGLKGRQESAKAPTLEALLAAGPRTRNHALVVTSHFARPDFVRMQHYFFKHYLKDEHTLIVVNDGLDEPSYRTGNRANVRQAIAKEANSLGIVHVKVPPELHDTDSMFLFPPIKRQDPFNAAHRCAVAVEFAYQNIVRKWAGPVLLLDSDMWPVGSFSLASLLNGTHMAGVKQSRTGKDNATVSYMWNGLVAFNISSLSPNLTSQFNFRLGQIRGIHTDVGGMNSFFFDEHEGKGLDVRWIKYHPLQPCHLDPNCKAAPKKPAAELLPIMKRDYAVTQSLAYCRDVDFCSEILREAPIFHYRSGGGWRKDQVSLHARRVILFDWGWLKTILGPRLIPEIRRYRTNQRDKKAVFIDFDPSGSGSGAGASGFLERWSRGQQGNYTLPLPLKASDSKESGASCFSTAAFTDGPFDVWLFGASNGTREALVARHPEFNTLAFDSIPSAPEASLDCPSDELVSVLRTLYLSADEFYFRGVARTSDQVACLNAWLRTSEPILFREICLGHTEETRDGVLSIVEELEKGGMLGNRVGTFAVGG